MMRWLFIFLLLGLAACQLPESGAALTEVAPAPSPTAEEWSQVEAEGVRLSLRTPAGWQSISNEYRILLAENAELHTAGEYTGILVSISAPQIDTLGMATMEAENVAVQVLSHVTKMPTLVGDSSVSQTVPVKIGEHDGAYYLLSDGDGNRVLVLAVAVPAARALVVCNISGSTADVRRFRDVLPMVLANLTINDQPVQIESLDWLPDPLVFPAYARAHTYDAEQTSTPGD